MIDFDPARCPYVSTFGNHRHRPRDDGWRCGFEAGHKNEHVLFGSDGERRLVSPGWRMGDWTKEIKVPDKSLPRVIKPKELAIGQHVSIRYDYDQKRSVIWEGLVRRVGDETVVLQGEDDYEKWVVNQPKVDITITLLAEPEPKYEVGQLADVTFHDNGFASTARCFREGDLWRAIPTSVPSGIAIFTDQVISVNLLRIAGPEDVIIPVVHGTVTLGINGWVKSVDKIRGELAGGLGGKFYEEMADLFQRDPDD